LHSIYFLTLFISKKSTAAQTCCYFICLALFVWHVNWTQFGMLMAVQSKFLPENCTAFDEGICKLQKMAAAKTAQLCLFTDNSCCQANTQVWLGKKAQEVNSECAILAGSNSPFPLLHRVKSLNVLSLHAASKNHTHQKLHTRNWPNCQIWRSFQKHIMCHIARWGKKIQFTLKLIQRCCPIIVDFREAYSYWGKREWATCQKSWGVVCQGFMPHWFQIYAYISPLIS